MGHILFGMRVVYGECLFITASPNRRHSSYLLRLSRNRENDISLKRATTASEFRRKHCGSKTPQVFTMHTLVSDPDGQALALEIDMPSLSDRQALNAQDPLSSVHHYLAIMYIVIPGAFGMRMCLNCPDCNMDTSDPDGRYDAKYCSCQDLCGNNNKLLGGYAGIAQSLAVATEFQGDGTPHGHGLVSLANAYQHGSLEDIAKLLQQNVHGFKPEDMLNRIVAFQEHLQREDHFDNAAHQRNLNSLESEFHTNNMGPDRNYFLSVRPRFSYEALDKPYLWKNAEKLEEAEREATDFQLAYETDVQFIFSHVQHHWHKLNDKGERVAMKYCMPKGRKCVTKCCTRGFPKKVIRDRQGKVNKEKLRARIVCGGVAAELNLKVSGRRNMLGSIAGLSYMIIVHDDHTRSSYMLIIYI
jgi:hypothetical protein